MNKVIIVASMAEEIPINENGIYYGVDKGAFFLAHNKIMMEYAIGDFDSVSEEEFILIKEYAKRIIVLNKEKNETDLEEAINLAIKNQSADLIIYGALGGRIDHLYANITLLLRFSKQVNIVLVDKYNYITCLTEQRKYVIKKDSFKYLSIFTPSNAKVSLSGFKYSSEELNLTRNDILGISNEIEEEEGIIKLILGTIILIKSNDEIKTK
jgi:thiamine pyrophosphokinase